MAVVQKQTWFLNGSGRTSATGVTPGFINNVKAYVHATPTASQCHFVVTGAVNDKYANKTHHLNVNSAGTKHRLTISAVHGCFGLIHNNDHPTFRATSRPSAAFAMATGPVGSALQRSVSPCSE